MSYNSLTIRGSLGFNAGSVLEQKRSLVISHDGGVEVVPLIEGEAVTIGRSYPADVVIAGRRLSRSHCRFELVDDEVWVEDLGSTNGTRVNGRRIDRFRLRLDAQVDLESTVSVSLHLLAPPAARVSGLWAHERVLVALEDEILRARLFNRQVALIMVRSVSRDPSELALWAPRVRDLLRPVDRIGLYGPDVVEILLPEITASIAHDLAQRILDTGKGGPRLRVGLALFPDQASTAEELIALSRLQAQRATETAPVQAGTTDLDDPEPGQGPLIAGSTLRAVYETVDRVAGSTIPVLIVGETGTGKELVARSVHERSPRAEGPMRCINCGAIPPTLLLSVLFGHERGAFTGADKRNKGLFEEAEGGTLLLDEIGELSAEAQVALLRVLETKTITRVGSSREIAVDVRILAATHRDIERMAQQGSFRLDLLYRLNTMTIQIPPLRGRTEEIAPLARHFLRLACQHHGCHVDAISAEAMLVLERYSWPGNVRQLRNVIERAVVMCPGNVVDVSLLPEVLRRNSLSGAGVQGLEGPVGASPPADPTGRRLPTEELAVPAPAGPSANQRSFSSQVQRFEVALLRSALTACAGNQTHTGVLLDLPRRTLIYKLNRFGIVRDAQSTEADAALLAEAEPQGPVGDYKTRVERYEALLIRQALQEAEGNQTVAARALDMRRRTLADKASRYGIGSG